MPFSLKPKHWFAWQMIPGYTGTRCVPYCSPIWVHSVVPKKTGQGILELEFWNVGYAEGVQTFTLELKILHRSADYLVSKLLYSGTDVDRCAVISHIEFGWLEKFCPWIWQYHPPTAYGPLAESSISHYLDAVFHPPHPMPLPPGAPQS